MKTRCNPNRPLGGEFLRLVLSLSLISVLALASQAQILLTPEAYVATPGNGTADNGSFNYFDDTGRQLVDGQLGVDDAIADLGQGPAYEWVGWRDYNPPTVVFSFSQSVSVSRVEVGDISFTLVGNEIPDQSRGWLGFDGAWTGSTLALNLSSIGTSTLWDPPIGWVFVDEVRFFGAVVPEPGTYAFAAALGLGVFALLRRRFAAK